MVRRHGIKMLGLGFLILLFFNRTVVGAEKSLVIKMGTLAPEGSSWMKTINTLNTEVTKKTEISSVLKFIQVGYWAMRWTCSEKCELAKFNVPLSPPVDFLCSLKKLMSFKSLSFSNL